MFVDMNQIGIKIATVVFNVKFRKYVSTERIRLFYVKFRKYMSTENLSMGIHSDIVHNSQKSRTTHMFITW